VLAVFDIDGVVADVRHRVHYLEGPHRSWERFFGAANGDGLLDTGARLVAELAKQHEIVWLSGRPEWLRPITAEWLTAHALPGAEMHLRPPDDYRPAARYKLSVLRTLQARGIAALVDDDDTVVSAAQAAGYPAVLADWLPRDPVLRQAQDVEGRT
jgi:hypothetical protein